MIATALANGFIVRQHHRLHRYVPHRNELGEIDSYDKYTYRGGEWDWSDSVCEATAVDAIKSAGGVVHIAFGIAQSEIDAHNASSTT